MKVFIRFSQAVPILKKVNSRGEGKFSKIVQPRNLFKIPSSFCGQPESGPGMTKLLSQGRRISYIRDSDIRGGQHLLNTHKVLMTKAYGRGGGEDFPDPVLDTPQYMGPGSCCSETYLLIGPFESEMEARNVMSYIRTKFFRFLAMLVKLTQNTARGTYCLIPLQDFSKPWSDSELYEKYRLADEEIEYIESTITEME